MNSCTDELSMVVVELVDDDDGYDDDAAAPAATDGIDGDNDDSDNVA